MPALQEYDIVEILTDPEFRKLPEPEQMKVMAEVDPEYAALAPEEQKKVLQDPEFQSESIKAEPPLTPEQVPGELDRLAAGRFAPTPPLPEFVTRPIDVPMPAVEPFTGPQPGPEPTPPEGPPLQIPEISPVAPGIGKLALQGAASGLGPVGAMGAVLRPDLTRLPEMVKKGAENVAAVLAENAKMGIMPGTAIPPALPADTAVGTEGYQAQAEKAAETYQAPVLPISELTPEPGLSRGIAQGIEGLTSPLNLSIAGALGGAGQAVRTVPSAARGIYNLLDTALAGYFAGAMAEGATEEVKAAYQAWQDGDYPAVAQHFGTATVEGLFAVAGATRVKKSVTGAKESFTRGYRRGQSRKAKLREEMGKAEAQQEAGKPPVVPNELPPAAAEVAVPEAPAPRPVVPAPPPPVVPPIVPPVVPPTPAVEEAVAPPVQPKATTFDQQMADYGRRLSEIAKSHDVDNLEAIVGEMEDFRNKGGARTDQQIKVLNSAIAKSWDTLQSVRRAEQQNAPVPQEVAPEMQTIDPAKMEVAEPKPAVPKAKEPWAMTRDQFFSQPHNPRDARFHGDQFHKDAIREAIGMGRPVPPEVLAEYPDLKPPAQAETTGQKEVIEEPTVEFAVPEKAEAPKLEAPIQRSTPRTGTPERQSQDAEFEATEKAQEEFYAVERDLRDKIGNARSGTKKRDALENKLKRLKEKGEPQQYEPLRKRWRQSQLEDGAEQTENPVLHAIANYELEYPKIADHNAKQKLFNDTDKKLREELRKLVPKNSWDESEFAKHFSEAENKKAIDAAVKDLANNYFSFPLSAEHPAKDLAGRIRGERLAIKRNNAIGEVDRLEERMKSAGIKFRGTIDYSRKIRDAYDLDRIDEILKEAEAFVEDQETVHKAALKDERESVLNRTKELKPVADIKPPAVTAKGLWNGNVLEPGRYVSDGHIVFDTEALPLASKKQGMSLANRQSDIGKIGQDRVHKEFWPKTVKGATNELTSLGHSTAPIQGGIKPAYFIDKGGKVYAVPADQLSFLLKVTEADSIRGDSPKSPIVFYREGKPVAALSILPKPPQIDVELARENAEAVAFKPKGHPST